MTDREEFGLVDGEICNRDGCKGIMQEVDSDSCCSCHIVAPCGHCENKEFECPKCGHIIEPPSFDNWKPTNYKQMEPRKTSEQLYNDLPDNEFGYIPIPGKYYWMEAKGKYPEDMTAAEILSKFNTCFGYKWIEVPRNGTFHLKYYTD